MHTGDSITNKALEYDNRRSQTPNDIEISDHDNYAKNRNMPGTSESVVSKKRSYTDIEEMCAELGRELVNTKKELAETMKRAEVRQIETEDQYEHTELIEENEIRKENKFIIEEKEYHKCTLNRGKTVDFNLTNSGNKRNTKVCRDIDIGKSKLSGAFDDPDKLYAVDYVCGDEPDRSKLSVASGQFDDAEINISDSSFLDEYVTVDPSVDMTSVDVDINRVRTVTLRVLLLRVTI
ncbi:unnamed protein product [Mytilus coruscus]|uniref:Uncharacterized protein n=1 Tax=Mytilus coruscus TaxID=42192 RepID=A0A6J8BS36_MYTCO|nr:unnamed protein product [Mytilus coruscus]